MTWIDDNRGKLQSLTGDSVREAMIVEMALSDGKSSPVWRHPALPLIQAQIIELGLASGRCARFHTYQNDDRFGIGIDFIDDTCRYSCNAPTSADPETGASEPSIFRIATDVAFPVGIISEVLIGLDDRCGDISDVRLSVGTQAILMKAGEVHESDCGYSLTSLDASILLFLNPADALNLHFR